jgi:hypothetical protein
MAVMNRGVLATIDLNLQEIQYVADHLQRSDCRKLVAALNDPNFYIENNIDITERKVPDDSSCLELLLQWNSQPGGGKGKSHVLLVRRLKQLGHDELAEWLSATVFRQLGDDVNRTLLMNPFKELAQTNEMEATVQNISTQTVINGEDEDDWPLMDTVCRILIMFFGSLVLLIPAYFAWKYLRRRSKKRKNKIKKQTVTQLGGMRFYNAKNNSEQRVEIFELPHNTPPMSESDETQSSESGI